MILSCTNNKKKNPRQEEEIWNSLICPNANYFREGDKWSPFIVERNILIAGFNAIEINTVAVKYIKTLLAMHNEYFKFVHHPMNLHQSFP